MDEESYTVMEVAGIAGVTIKTLHHYDALGLLKPARVSGAGYRLYTHVELERLQQILFYRELDFPLKEISALLRGVADRSTVLREQREQLLRRRRHLAQLIKTINTSIWYAEKGSPMNAKAMFDGFESADEWNSALEEHNDHLEAEYGVTVPEVTDAAAMNEMAAEASGFMKKMAVALRNKIACDDATVRAVIEAHVAFLAAHGHAVTFEEFAKQTKFFLRDSFHRAMLEDQQVGLAYYLAAAAEAYAQSCVAAQA